MPVFRIGVDDFKKLRDNGGYFVDKSLFIQEIIAGNDVTLLPRPRRFGKTLNMTMLRYFFERCDEDRGYLFQNLAIASYPDCMKHQGQYPVIFISLKDVKGTTWDEMRNRLIEKIGELLIPLAYLRPDLPPIYQRGFDALYTGTPDDATLKASLKNLITWLYTFHKKPVIVLIDEYDTPMIEGWQNGYYDEIAEFLRSWLGGGLKHENAHALYRAVITGILRVAKESIFSGLNNLFVSTSLLPNTLSTMFGFTEDEVLQILKDFGRLDQADIVREWYNGYRFGSQTIYNPWSVSMYISQYPAPPAPYWLNTASNTLVYEELGKGGIGIKQDLERLLSGDGIRYPITETITFRDIGKNPANIWSFLYFSGYLRADDPRFADYNPTLLTYALSIPNLEISTAYQQFVNNTFVHGDTTTGMESFVSFFLESKSKEVLEDTLQNLILSLVSYHDLANLPEAVFHAFVLGLLANLRAVYEIRSQPETGFGRADILMIPKDERFPVAYVIEFKSVRPDEDIGDSAEKALLQVQKKHYDTALHSAGIHTTRIRRLAIVLQGKTVVVREAGHEDV